MRRNLLRFLRLALFGCALVFLFSHSALAAVTFVSKSQVIGNGTSPTVTEPAGCASGNAEIAIAVADVGTLTRPAGWTQLFSGTLSQFMYDVSWISRGGSAPALQWTVAGSVYREVHVICVAGSGAVTLDAQSSSGGTGNASAHDPDPPSATAVASTSLAVALIAHWSGSGGSGWTAPAGYTLRTDNSVGNDGAIATKALSGAGAENPGAFTGTGAGTSNYWDGATLTFTDDGTPPPARQPCCLLGVWQ